MDMEEVLEESSENTEQPAKELHFKCPNCGKISQDEVVFLCNKCDSKEMIAKDGVFICPQCLTKGENFMCMNCNSKEVILTSEI